MRLIYTLVLSLLISASINAQQKLTVGTGAPDFSAQAIGGKQFNMKELHGKVVVLTFWSTRCEICHSEIPKLNQVAAKFADKDVVFLAATMESEAKIQPYLQKNQFVFNILPSSFGVVLKYADTDQAGNINMGFPSYFIIDKRGDINVKSDGWDKTNLIETQITRLLAN